MALLLLPFVVLGHAFVPGKVMSPADNVLGLAPWAGIHPGASARNPLLSEITLLFHPSTLYAAAAIHAGRFPLWNPHTFAGAPFFANPQTAVLFPLTALSYVLPPALALTLMSVLKLSMAGVGMWWLLRRLAVGRGPALIGGLTFAFNALLIVWLQWSYASAFVLLPLMFGMAEVVRARPGPRAAAGVAVIVALALLAGYPQRVVFWLVVISIWIAHRAWTVPHPRRVVAWSAVGIALGIALGAVQLLPFAEYTLASAVLAYRTDWMIYFPLPLRAAATLLMPNAFGNPATKDFWGPANFNEISVYVGVVPWLVLPVAVLGARARAGTIFFLALLGISAAIVYGVPGVGPALAALPPFDTTIAVRNADLLVFSLCVLAAFGLDTLARLEPTARRVAAFAVRVAFSVVVLAAFGFVASVQALAGKTPPTSSLWSQYLWLLVFSVLATLIILHGLRRPGHGTSVVGLAAIQLAALAPLAVIYNPVVDASLLDYSPPPVVKHLQARTAADGARVSFTGIGGANLSTIFRLFEVGGYDGMTPRYVEQLVDPVGSLEAYASGALRVTVDPASPIVDLAGIRYIVLPPHASSTVPHFAVDYRGPDAVVYRNEHALPRAFVVSQSRTCLDDAAALALIRAGGVDVRREVVIAGCDEASTPGTPDPSAHAQIVSYRPDRVVLEATSERPGYLVLTDAWFPGWRARVDGVERPVRRADHAFRAVSISAGHHEIEFRYEPATFFWGLAATLGAAVGLVALLTRSSAWVASCVVVGAIVATSATADAKLAAPPFRLDATPAGLSEGQPLTITLQQDDATPAAAEPYDVYISVSADNGSRRGWLFMTSSGTLSAGPAPFRRAAAGNVPSQLTATLGGLPPGWFVVRVQFVRPSAVEPTRKHYIYQPLWATIRVDPRVRDDSSARTLAVLGAVTLVAGVITWLVPRDAMSVRRHGGHRSPRG